MRKLLSEGFVSVLNQSCLKYIWDLMFLHSWSKAAQKTVATAILLLLEPWMKKARTFTDMRNVFLEEPFHLYLMD